MGSSTSGGSNRFSRRGFLLGAGVGAVGGAGLMAAWQHVFRRPAVPLAPDALRSFTGRSKEIERPAHAMPGPYPGRVVEVRHPDCVSPAHEVRPAAVKAMIDRGMTELTGASHPVEAWRRFFEPGDVVGIKVNPVGYSRRKGVVGSISSPAVLLEIVENLKQAGVKPRDIIVFERYATEFREAGYEKVMLERSMQGVRWYASSSGYDNGQLDIEGQGPRTYRERDRHVV